MVLQICGKMKTASILVTLFLGLAAASPMKRQDVATPPRPTSPPMTTMTSGSMMSSTGDMNTPPSPSAVPAVTTVKSTMAPVSSTEAVTTAAPTDSTTMAPATTQAVTTAPTTSAPVTTEKMTTQPPVTTPTPAPITTPKITTMTTGTMAPVTPSKIVSVDEIVATFNEVADTDFYKDLPYDQQLIVLKILAGGEVGKMTTVLEQIGFEDLLNFMYRVVPLRYQDTFHLFIEEGFSREKLVLQQQPA